MLSAYRRIPSTIWTISESYYSSFSCGSKRQESFIRLQLSMNRQPFQRKRVPKILLPKKDWQRLTSNKNISLHYLYVDRHVFTFLLKLCRELFNKRANSHNFWDEVCADTTTCPFITQTCSLSLKRACTVIGQYLRV